jgi:hypothetical protein
MPSWQLAGLNEFKLCAGVQLQAVVSVVFHTYTAPTAQGNHQAHMAGTAAVLKDNLQLCKHCTCLWGAVSSVGVQNPAELSRSLQHVLPSIASERACYKHKKMA